MAPWLAALPLIFMGHPGRDQDQLFNSALAAASAALDADLERHDSRSRVCFLIAELASQFGRQTNDWVSALPVSLAQLSRATGTSLTRLRRILGFLALSQVVERTENGLRILDWERLCLLGHYDRAWIALPVPDEADSWERPATELARREVTLTGEPASFV
jgi:hypothetical protein